MEIARNIIDILELVIDFLGTELPNLPFSILDVWSYCLIGSLVVYIYYKVMGM